MDRNTDGGGQAVSNTAGDQRFLSLRIVALAALMFGLSTWSEIHLGIDPLEIAALNGFLASVGIVLGLIEEGVAGRLEASFKAIFLPLLNGQVILALYLITLVGTSLFSSVTVTADGHSGSSRLYLNAQGSAMMAR